jgi:hypothetical protein
MTEIPYYFLLGRTQLPPPGNQPALVVPLDYDEVIPVEKDRTPFQAIEDLFRLQWQAIDDFMNLLIPHLDLHDIPMEERDSITPYWNNSYFGLQDGRIAYSMIRALAPRQVVEVGSGHSTRFMRKAIIEGSLKTRLISIDPQPRKDITLLADEIMPENICNIPLKYFDRLECGDVLFLDASHLTVHGSDVVHVILRILPNLAPGVVVHFHDIYLPAEYPTECDRFYYSEQYLLAAFLLGNNDWEILVPVHDIFLRGRISSDGASFWMRRKVTGGLGSATAESKAKS